MANKKSIKRIVMISVHSDPLAKIGSLEAGGQNIYVGALSKELGHRGIGVDIFTRLDSKRKKKIINYSKNVRVIRLHAGPRRFIPKELLAEHLPEFISKFLYFKKENKLNYDLVHGHYWEGGWVAIQIKRILKIPMVQTFHSLGYIRYHTLKKFGEEKPNSKEFNKRIKIEKEIMEVVNKIIATSPYEKEDIIKYYKINPEKIKIIPCGVDLKKIKPVNFIEARKKINYPKEKKLILYVGRIEWRKGISTLIRALAEIIKLKPELKENLRLIVIGNIKSQKDQKADKGEVRRLKDLSRSLNIRELIDFLGLIPQELLRFYYSAADVCVIPSYYEPFGLVALEAMSAKTPVIASSIGGLKYTIEEGKTGLLFPPRHPKILAKKIIKIFNQPDLKEKLIKNAYTQVKEKFSWSIIVQHIIELYKSIIKNHEKT